MDVSHNADTLYITGYSVAVIILITELPNLIGYIRRKAEKRKN